MVDVHEGRGFLAFGTTAQLDQFDSICVLGTTRRLSALRRPSSKKNSNYQSTQSFGGIGPLEEQNFRITININKKQKYDNLAGNQVDFSNWRFGSCQSGNHYFLNRPVLYSPYPIGQLRDSTSCFASFA